MFIMLHLTTLSKGEKENLRNEAFAVVLTKTSPSMRLKTGGKNSDDTSGGSC
jgi:hypothetical protein